MGVCTAGENPGSLGSLVGEVNVRQLDMEIYNGRLGEVLVNGDDEGVVGVEDVGDDLLALVGGSEGGGRPDLELEAPGSPGVHLDGVLGEGLGLLHRRNGPLVKVEDGLVTVRGR